MDNVVPSVGQSGTPALVILTLHLISAPVKNALDLDDACNATTPAALIWSIYGAMTLG